MKTQLWGHMILSSGDSAATIAGRFPCRSNGGVAMRRANVLIPLIAAPILGLAACGAKNAESSGSDADTQPAPVQQASDQRSSNAVPKISTRTYISGSAQVTVSGFFEVKGSQELYKPASLTDDSQTWLQYGNSGLPGLDVTVTSNETESGVVIGNGPFQVTAGNDECKITFDVTPTVVSGHISCAEATGYNKKSGQMGKVSVDVAFNAMS